ncbi:MAG: sugar transferase [Caldilineaceae bacterium]|nr:sugar transferase [Caldilineaceae bacterium]
MQLPGALRTILFGAGALQPDSEKAASGGYSFSERLAFLMLIDGLLVSLVVWGTVKFVPLVYQDHLRSSVTRSYWVWFTLLIGGWWLFAGLLDLYDVSTLHRRISTAARVILTVLADVTVFFVVTLLVPLSLSLDALLYFLGTATPLLILWRWAYIPFSTLPIFSHRTLIVGQGERARRASELVSQHSYLNCRVLGYISDTPDLSEPSQDGLPVWNDPVGLPQWVRDLQIHEIVIATERNLDRQLYLSLIECKANGTQVIWLPDLYERFGHNIPIDQVDPHWVLNAVQSGPDIFQRTAKRLLDLTIAAFTLPVLLVFMPLVALAVKLDSTGPIFYKQTRCGRAGKPFKIYKFRTMYVDAERDGKARWATKNDPRITRVGRILRKTRMDELPQVLNILRGEMSFVGPRPERPEFVEELKTSIPFYHSRLAVKPGLTGWAQVQFEYTSTVEDTLTKLQYDLYYIHRWSLWLDIYILFRTISVVFKLKGT